MQIENQLKSCCKTSCHSVLDTESSTHAVSQRQQPRQAWKMPSQVQHDSTNLMGFTLIELLVVVLIIGILAAVAVPQYKTAVIKSRLSSVKQIMYNISKAEQVYYLANQTYTDDRTLLDLTFEQCANRYSGENSVLACDNNWVLDIILGNQPVIDAYYCPNKATSYSVCDTNKEFIYRTWFDNSKPDSCTGYTDFGRFFCKKAL